MQDLRSLSKSFIGILYLTRPSATKISALALCYLTITIFDLMSLGIVFLVVNGFLGISKQAPFLFNHHNVDSTTLLLALPVVWFVKFLLVLLANLAVIKFSQQAVLSLRNSLVNALFSSNNPSKEQADKEVWLDTLNRQLSFASTGVIEPALRAIFDLIVLVLVCVFITTIAPIPFLTTLLWIGSGMMIYDKLVRRAIEVNSMNSTVKAKNLPVTLSK